MGYSTKSSLWSAICSTSTEITSLQNTRELLLTAYNSLTIVEGDAFSCDTELIRWKDSLNSFFSGTNWEGSQVCQTQNLMSDAMVEHTKFILSGCSGNKDTVLAKINSINEQINVLQSNKTSLTNQYNNWDANHRSS